MINGGAIVRDIEEQWINYNVGIMLADILRSDNRFEVRTSRNSIGEVLGYNSSSSLAMRANQANAWPADYFISIHCNANPNPDINGAEVYVYRYYTQAEYLAQHILNKIVQIVGIRDNGVRTNPSLYVLRKTTMPAVLVELGYMTNPSDLTKLLQDQGAYAYAIYMGLLEYFGFVPLN
ncbi:MAG: N-acetylmuramoyl-L-alanine amidase [Lachnospiraceae bacterium]|jgi:N-acetylmuramoyl-L-alanine amidase|nr:N-acetylmuramoyl-L-alanine amidase [Lachnospiraceae bacterium]